MDKRLEGILITIARKANIRKPYIKYAYQCEKGDGYLGKLQMFDITEEDGNEDNKLSMVVKQSPPDPTVYAVIPMKTLFQTEIWFYTKIAPVLIDLQLEYNVKCLNFPKCLYTDNSKEMQEILIIENLIPKGFTMLDRTIPMKFAHMKIAFEEFAKLHGLGYALKVLKPELHKQLMEPLHISTCKDLYIPVGFDAFVLSATKDFRKLLLGTEYHDLFCQYFDKIMEEFIKLDIIDEYAVFTHGDAWSNNIMYTHDANDIPTSAMYIDYQLCKIHSPVMDLSYLFYSCADIDLIPKLNDFLGYYHNTLAETLAVFGLDIKRIYPRDKLLEHWKRYAKVGLIWSFLIRVLLLSTPEETPDVSEAVTQKEPIMRAMYYYKMERQEEYNSTLLTIIKHFIDKKYIN